MTTKRAGRRIKHRLAMAAAVLAAAVGSTVALDVSAADAAGPAISSNTGYANIRSCPHTNCVLRVQLSNGTPVGMQCWRDAQWTTGDYYSNRWFYVLAAYGSIPVDGWVHSSLVDPQVATPPC